MRALRACRHIDQPLQIHAVGINSERLEFDEQLGDEQRRTGFDQTPAVCGFRPADGRGWILQGEERVTCPDCRRDGPGVLERQIAEALGGMRLHRGTLRRIPNAKRNAEERRQESARAIAYHELVIELEKARAIFR
jgi:hypothetical protein